MAVDALRRAVQLSEDAPSRGRRLERAALTAFESGYPVRAPVSLAVKTLRLTG